MMCAGESLPDFSGTDGRTFGNRRGRSNYMLLVTKLRDAWSNLAGAVDRNENVGAPTVTALFDLVYVFFELRYERCVLILPQGRLREEVLANVSRQLAELRLYFSTFQRLLSDRCTRKPYAELAQFACCLHIRLLGPTVQYLLDADGGSSGTLLPAALPGCGSGFGGEGSLGLPAAAAPPAARCKLGVTDHRTGESLVPKDPSADPALSSGDFSGIRINIWNRAKVRRFITHFLAGGGTHNRGYHALRWEMILHGHAGEMGKYAVLSVLPDQIARSLYEYNDT